MQPRRVSRFSAVLWLDATYPPDIDFRKANDMDADEDTFTDRFLSHAIRLFLEGCTAKNKVVRMRVLQCITEIIASLKTLEYVPVSR